MEINKFEFLFIIFIYTFLLTGLLYPVFYFLTPYQSSLVISSLVVSLFLYIALVKGLLVLK